jgi:hypothetical protein
MLPLENGFGQARFEYGNSRMTNTTNALLAKKAKMMRANRNKARLVKHTLVRLWGKTTGENWFYGTRWAAYDSYANLEQNIRDQKYADALQGNVYVRAEAERRLALGLNFENTVRNALVAVQCDPQRVADIYNEVGARIQRNDEVFETEVSKVMYDLHNA